MYAALGGSASATSALLQYGANMFACTISTTWGVAGSPASQSNVLMFAVMGKNEDCVRVLLRHYVSPIGILNGCLCLQPESLSGTAWRVVRAKGIPRPWPNLSACQPLLLLNEVEGLG